MEVPAWSIPIIVALIAAWPIYYGAVSSRRTAKEAAEFKEAELAISGLTTLLAETSADRRYCWEVVADLRAELRDERRKGDELATERA